MTEQVVDYDSAMRDFEIEAMLLVNSSLFQKGYISNELCTKAKELILKH